jgi:predicted DNA-binding ribbon-helix-helix protein
LELVATLKQRGRDGGRAWRPVNIFVDGHRTSIRLEPVMWEGLSDIQTHHGIGLDELVTRINKGRDPRDNLTAAIRVYIVEFYRSERLKRMEIHGLGAQAAVDRRRDAS